METLSFQAPLELKQQIEFYAKKLDRSKAYLIRQAIEEYIEDLQDYLDAKQYKASYNPKENVPLAQLKKKHGLE